jgi:hypothetical protein
MVQFKCMSTREADRLIASGAPVTIRFPEYREQGVFILVSRDRVCVNTANGSRFHRSDMEIVE